MAAAREVVFLSRLKKRQSQFVSAGAALDFG
jgi:hypothetical protein